MGKTCNHENFGKSCKMGGEVVGGAPDWCKMISAIVGTFKRVLAKDSLKKQ